MRISAILLVLAFLLAEGVALIPGPCCLNALLGPQGGNPVACSHHSQARSSGCCDAGEPASPPCCCSERQDASPAMDGAKAPCQCRFQGTPETDKSLDSGVEVTGLQPVGVVSTLFLEIPDSPDPEDSMIREGTGPPAPSLTLTLQVLLL